MSGFSLRRSLAILKKEFIQLRRDIVTLQMIVMVPIMQLLLFGYALNNDPRNLPAAVFSQDNGMFSRSFVSALKNTTYFSIDYNANSEEELKELLQQGKVQFVINIPVNFTRDLVRGQRPQLLVEADATDPTAISGALASLEGVLNSVIERDFKGVINNLKASPPPVSVEVHRLYNPEGFTRYNIVPGLIAIILTMTGIMMTSLSITKERERGTMENLLAMPIAPLEVMAGKIVPYVIIGFIQSFIIILASKFLFDIPILGSMVLFSFALFIFITCNMAMGFILSSSSENSAQSLQMSMIVTLPSIMLSGFLFPFRGMPIWAQVIGSAMPATYFIQISRGILLKGNNFLEIWPHLWPMCIILVLVVLFAIKSYKRTLD